MRKKKKKSEHYFTKVHENAIVQYALTDDLDIRTELYRDYIGPVFNELVDKIVYTYKFTSLPNIDELKEDCKIWLTTILDKFDPEKGSKAFSYFSVITKNWFIHKVKKNTIKNMREVHYDDLSRELEYRYVVEECQYEVMREDAEFWQFLWKEIDSWENIKMKPNEEKVYRAIKVLLANSNDIEIFNKKAIYLYIRELTGLNTKQVVNNLNKMRKKYREWKRQWSQGRI